MKKSRILSFAIMLGGALAAPLQLDAQPEQDSLLLSDYAFLKQRDAWLTGQNAAALSRFGAGNLSDARLSCTYDWGSLADYHESPKSLDYGASVESFFRLNPRIVLYGSIGYDNFTGHRMAGSAFIDPTRMPFDIMEDSLTNLGRKHRDTYHLVGAVSGEVYRRVALGVKVDYTAANYAKYKDLRHKNALMDMILTAGVYAPLARGLQLGADFYYRRTTESLRFSTYGNSDKVYKSLVAYAAFMGKVEAFGENGYTDKSREMPFFSEYKGVGVQAGWDITPQVSWYNDFSYRSRDGYYGKKSSYTISYNEHNSDIFAYHGRLTLRQRQNQHDLDVAFETEDLEDYSNSYREVERENTSRYYEYYTPVKLSNKTWTTFGVSYTANLGLRGLTPTWMATMGYDYARTRQMGYEYPYFRRQSVSRNAFSATLLRNLFLRSGIFSAGLGLSYQKGSGKPFTDGTLATPSDKQAPPPEMTAYLYRNYEYLTSAQWGVEASAKYAFAWKAVKMKPYVSLGYRLRKAADVEWLEGSLRQHLQFTLGATF